MNNKLIELVEKDSIYEDVSPMLFRDQFTKQSKGREDQLWCLDWTVVRSRIFAVAALWIHHVVGGGGVAHIPAITASATEEVASIPTLKSSGTNPVEKKTSP